MPLCIKNNDYECIKITTTIKYACIQTRLLFYTLYIYELSASNLD